jgi:hypothetical protein
MDEASESRHLNFNNNMSTTAVFLDIGKAFDTTRHPGLLYKLPELKLTDFFNFQR